MRLSESYVTGLIFGGTKSEVRFMKYVRTRIPAATLFAVLLVEAGFGVWV